MGNGQDHPELCGRRERCLHRTRAEGRHVSIRGFLRAWGRRGKSHWPQPGRKLTIITEKPMAEACFRADPIQGPLSSSLETTAVAQITGSSPCWMEPGYLQTSSVAEGWDVITGRTHRAASERGERWFLKGKLEGSEQCRAGKEKRPEAARRQSRGWRAPQRLGAGEESLWLWPVLRDLENWRIKANRVRSIILKLTLQPTRTPQELDQHLSGGED